MTESQLKNRSSILNDFIYLDYQSTTPCDPRVVEKMLPYFTDIFGNPHSRNHSFGWMAEEAVENARKELALLIGADEREVIFTSGATESNNLAIKGLAGFYGDQKRHIITCVTEHKCVLESCRQLEQQGFEITYLPVHQNGLIDLNILKNAIRSDTLLVSIMMVNNEIGVIQPVKEIGALCRQNNVFFHTDAAQAAGKMPIDVNEMNIDLLSISGHKMYGPKGVGALFVRRKPRVRLNHLLSGGGQERGMRSGTLSPALCAGLGEAARIARLEMDAEIKRVQSLTQLMLSEIRAHLDEVYLNGDEQSRIPGSLNLSFAYVEGEGLMMGIKELAVSSGSACTSSSLEPSYVLRALGVEEELAHTSIRFGMGRFTTEDEIRFACAKLIKAVKKLRDMSPLWEMAQEGINIKDIQWAAH
ncbi:MAG: IscS subfamily cysteine desulfurase [Candidatus Puniceispirillum sp.]|nr:IscS subfamily cysteine desulfurase [Candidatus Pelagibacter sp.]MBA4283123.1 IscS subfamily cysteine desulfurase [Candidatus Puniceispirillum sp.]